MNNWYDNINTPAFVADIASLQRNLERASLLKHETGCKILLATKAFARVDLFPLLREVLDGTTASGLYEAKLGHEDFGKEVHVYSPAFTPEEINDVIDYADHIYFNSPTQMERFSGLLKKNSKIGMRINPQYSKVSIGGDLYNPAARYSRFGTTINQLDDVVWDAVDILHTHALCEADHQGSVGLIEHVAKTFGRFIKQVDTVNFGGGHFFNHDSYDLMALINAIKRFQDQFGVNVILEPGGGLVCNGGYLVASVVDIHCNEKLTAILDASASCHHPDIIEANYPVAVLGSAPEGTHPYNYILGGKTCMTGDIFGTYSFTQPLQIGSKIIFLDSLHYTFVKSTVFNGTPLPDFGILDSNKQYTVTKTFGYQDFRNRLG